MSAYQNTTVLLDGTREAEPSEHVEAVMTVQDVAGSLHIDDATVHDGIQGGTAETITKPSRDHRQLIYPAWPTSTPGPQATLPPPGQKPLPTRTDQMIYECYDQERGRPCVPPPTRVARENRTRTYLPDANLRKVEAEAMERWLDDGGASDNEAVYDVRGFSPLQFFKS